MSGTPVHENLWPFLTYSLLVAAIVAGALGIGRLLGGTSRKTAASLEPFESGIVPVGSADELRMPVHFYLVAMFFVIFDLEAIYLFAWAAAFRDLGWQGYAGAGVFIAILFAVLVYELRSGALDWGPRPRRGSDAAGTALPGDGA